MGFLSSRLKRISAKKGGYGFGKITKAGSANVAAATPVSSGGGLAGLVKRAVSSATGGYGFGKLKKVGSVSQRGNIFGN